MDGAKELSTKLILFFILPHSFTHSLTPTSYHPKPSPSLSITFNSHHHDQHKYYRQLAYSRTQTTHISVLSLPFFLYWVAGASLDWLDLFATSSTTRPKGRKRGVLSKVQPWSAPPLSPSLSLSFLPHLTLLYSLIHPKILLKQV